MKAKSTHPETYYHSTVAWTLGAAALLIAAGTAFGQDKKIVIEAGPEPVAISDRDGKPEGALTNRDIRVAASDQEGEVTVTKVKDGEIVTTTERRVVEVDTDNDGRSERYLVLYKELNVIDTDAGPLIRMNADVLFDFDKTTIKPKAADMLDKVAEFIALSGDGKVEVVGYADAIGAKEYNSDLAWNRSLSVVKWLQSQEGFSRDRFRAVGRGEEGEVAPNTVAGKDNPEGRKMNRRVEILIRDQDDAPAEVPRLK